jgi:colanic acid/amylovoran biosynthesis protein
MKKITITNAYTWYNKGDAGILLGIVSMLKKQYGEENIEINILSFTPEVDGKHYCEDKCIKKVCSNTLNPHPYKHTKIGKFLAITKLFARMCKLYLASKISLKKLTEKEESLKILNDSDLIIVCGGGFLGGKKYDSLMHVFQIYLDTLFKAKVIIMGTSIEPMQNSFIKRKTENVLKRVDFVFARENITYEYLKTFLPQEKFKQIPDMAFMLPEENRNFKIIDDLRQKTDLIIGITVRKWNFPNLNISAKEAMENYENVVAQMMEKYIEEKNAYFVFVPQVTVYTGNDIIEAKKIKEKLLKNQEHFIVLEDDFSPNEIKSLIGNFEIFIGTRMHSNIFAISMKVPLVAIAYEKKTNGIMETAGLSDYIVEMDTITLDELEKKVEKALASKEEIKAKLEKKVPELKAKIEHEIKECL